MSMPTTLDPDVDVRFKRAALLRSGDSMRIGEIAARAGVSVRALRYYEEQGLLSSTRTSGGQRRYADGAVARVRWIRLLLGAGLPSSTIRDLLPCVESGEVTPEVLLRLAQERARIHRQATELLTVRDRLDALIAAAEETGAGCHHVPDAAVQVAPSTMAAVSQ
jgi:MerR family transcriptional regulator, redox-sensitive transcriptional activator SoxR